MENPAIVYLYLLLMLLQLLHIFEEIGMEAYLIAGSLTGYLLVASAIVTGNFLALFLMMVDLPVGYVLGLVGAVMGIANGIVHVAGYVKTWSMRGTLGAGLFTGVPLAVAGGLVLYRLASVFL